MNSMKSTSEGNPATVQERGGSPRVNGKGRREAQAQEAVRAIQHGFAIDDHFRRLFDLYAHPCRLFFQKRGFSPSDAEDLVQDVFFRVYRGIGAFRFDASFETWFFRIVTNVWKNALRQIESHKPATNVLEPKPNPVAAGGAAPEPAAREPDPLTAVLEQEQVYQVEQACDQLPPRMRQCILLHYGQELRYRDIATLLKIEVSTVKEQLKSGKARLQPLLSHLSHLNLLLAFWG